MPELSQQQALAEYQLACASADDLVRTNAAGLQCDQLLGTAKMLSIYGSWRVLAMQGVDAGTDAARPETRVCAMDAEALSAYAMQVAREHAVKADQSWSTRCRDGGRDTGFPRSRARACGQQLDRSIKQA